jgi:hypothetical protein
MAPALKVASQPARDAHCHAANTGKEYSSCMARASEPVVPILISATIPSRTGQ